MALPGRRRLWKHGSMLANRHLRHLTGTDTIIAALASDGPCLHPELARDMARIHSAARGPASGSATVSPAVHPTVSPTRAG